MLNQIENKPINAREVIESSLMNKGILEKRSAIVELLFENADFGDSCVEDHEGIESTWSALETDAVEFSKVFYVEVEGKASEKAVFAVVFAPNSTEVLDVCALIQSTGCNIYS